MRTVLLLVLLLFTTSLFGQGITYRIVGVEEDSTIIDVCGTIEVKYNNLHSGKVKIKLGTNKIYDKFTGEYDEYDMGEYHIHMKLKRREYTICIHHNTMTVQLKDGTIFKYVVRMVEDTLSYCH